MNDQEKSLGEILFDTNPDLGTLTWDKLTCEQRRLYEERAAAIDEEILLRSVPFSRGKCAICNLECMSDQESFVDKKIGDEKIRHLTCHLSKQRDQLQKERDDAKSQETGLRAIIEHLAKENESFKEDIKIAAGEMLVELPLPHTPMSRMLTANRILKNRISDLRSELAAMKDKLKSMSMKSEEEIEIIQLVRKGFMTCKSNSPSPGRHTVSITFTELRQAQRLHGLLLGVDSQMEDEPEEITADGPPITVAEMASGYERIVDAVKPPPCLDCEGKEVHQGDAVVFMNDSTTSLRRNQMYHVREVRHRQVGLLGFDGWWQADAFRVAVIFKRQL